MCIYEVTPSLKLTKGLYFILPHTDGRRCYQQLENMKLTTEEEELIAISDEGRKEEIESRTLSLIGKFLTCKPFNKRVAQNTLRRAWGLDEGVQMVEVGSNLF